jgi:hypothetical protein
MKKIVYNVDFILPDIIENYNVPNMVSFGSCVLFKKLIPGVFIFCDEKYLTRANIEMEKSTKVPDHKLRLIKGPGYLNEIIYLFELELIYKNGYSARIHFDPKEESFKDLCVLGAKSNLFSINYCLINSSKTVSTHLEMSDENKEWFKRNLLVAKQINNNSKFTDLIAYFKSQYPKSEYFVQEKKPTFLDVLKNKS